jgi:hypothetical protein
MYSNLSISNSLPVKRHVQGSNLFCPGGKTKIRINRDALHSEPPVISPKNINYKNTPNNNKDIIYIIQNITKAKYIEIT